MRGFVLLVMLAAAGAPAAVARAADSTLATPAVRAVEPAADALGPAPAAVSLRAFEGIWMFDAAHSDDPQKVMESRAAGREGGRRPGGMHGGGMGGERMGGGAGEGMGGGPPAGEEGDGGFGSGTDRRGGDARRAFDRVMHPAKKMVVYLDRDRFQVEEDEGAARVYTVADSLAALDAKPLQGEATVRLRGGTLEARQPLARGGAALIESYTLSADGRVLTIRARREGGPSGRPATVFTRVYRRYEGE